MLTPSTETRPHRHRKSTLPPLAIRGVGLFSLAMKPLDRHFPLTGIIGRKTNARLQYDLADPADVHC